jgi:hypothetical protein
MILSIIAILISLLSIGISYFLSNNANKTAKQAYANALGNTELEINEKITTRDKEWYEFLVDFHSKLLASDTPPQEITKIELLRDATIERMLNTYDEVCGLYLDGKVDKDRFKKDQQVRIRDLFQNEYTKPCVDTISTPYHAIRKVYIEWENPEEQKG